MTNLRASSSPFGVVISIALGVALSVGTAGVSQASDLVDVPDTRLAACLATDLASEGIGTELTAAHLAQLNRLVCSGVADLTGAAHLSGLAHLHLSDSTVSDLTALSGLSALETVWLESDAPMQLSPLTTLPKLDKLGVTLRTSTDATPLANLSTLGTLVVMLEGGRPSDFPIAVSVTDLDVRQVSSLAELRPAPGVRTVRLSGPLTSLDGVAALSGLTTLTVPAADSKIAELAPLADLAELRTLELHSSALTDLSPLATLSKLAELRLSGSRISNLAPLSGLQQLTTLDLSNNQLTDLSPISGHPALTSLSAAGNLVTVLGGSGSLRSLTTADLGHNQLTSIAALAGAPLSYVDLSQNRLTEIGALSSISADALAVLDKNQIRDLSPLPDSVRARADGQILGNLGEAHVGVPAVLGVRGIDGSGLCPSTDPASATCLDGAITYDAPGTYQGWFSQSAAGSAYSATYVQHAGPDLAFTTVPKVATLSERNTKVGLSLRANTGRWLPAPTRLDYQWYVGGQLRAGGEFNTYYYDITTADLGKRIKVCVVGHRNGYLDARTCSAQSKPVGLGDLSVQTKPKISGPARVGGTVRVTSGTWTPGTTLHYQWLRNGHPIKGATRLSYRITRKDARAKIQVKVTGTQHGFHSSFVYTTAVRPKR